MPLLHMLRAGELRLLEVEEITPRPFNTLLLSAATQKALTAARTGLHMDWTQALNFLVPFSQARNLVLISTYAHFDIPQVKLLFE